jgi:hypothetical protein
VHARAGRRRVTEGDLDGRDALPGEPLEPAQALRQRRLVGEPVAEVEARCSVPHHLRAGAAFAQLPAAGVGEQGTEARHGRAGVAQRGRRDQREAQQPEVVEGGAVGNTQRQGGVADGAADVGPQVEEAPEGHALGPVARRAAEPGDAPHVLVPHPLAQRLGSHAVRHASPHGRLRRDHATPGSTSRARRWRGPTPAPPAPRLRRIDAWMRALPPGSAHPLPPAWRGDQGLTGC